MYVDNQHSCSFYASKELAALATDTTATNFFCQELVQKPHERLRPHEFLLSKFTPATLKEQQLQFMSDSKSRQKTWRERAGNLQALSLQRRLIQTMHSCCSWKVGKMVISYWRLQPN